ncbi:MAG: NADH-quinone oxidoreductase subunit N [Candidatus Sumerlaeaceae bacterium]|nr:NADH-quinone oxidoreductase subunit N [Candidatus Sumerlaeaceae bacterium]
MSQYLSYLPDFLLGIGGTTALLVGAWQDTKAGRDFVRWLSLVTFVLAGASVIFIASLLTTSPWVVWNSLTVAFSLLFLGIGGWIVLVESAPATHAGEWYALVQYAVLGMLVLARSANLAALFLGIETLSLALYVLIAFRYSSRANLRGGVMYLVLASFASAFLAFGLALLYAASGTINTSELAKQFSDGLYLSPIVKIGLALFLVGIGFKLAVVPFHMWAPDVYDAAPSTISGVIASASKGAVIAALFPLAVVLKTHGDLLYGVTVLSVIIGNLLGLLEQRPKRILAYSSIAHVGYILTGYLALQASWPAAATGATPLVQVIWFYVVGYSLAALGAFAVFSQLEDGRPLYLRDLRGLLKRHPLAAWLLLVFVISLAGIPPTIGFLAKLYLFLEAVRAGYLWPVLWALVGSAIGVYYYGRIIAQLFMSASEGIEMKIQRDKLRDAVLTVTACLVVFFGVLPSVIL